MDSFNFFFSFYGLLLGFSVAAVVRGLAGILSTRRELTITALPALLGIFLLQDMATLWVFAWDTRAHLKVNYLSIYGAMVVATLYYVAAILAFPIKISRVQTLEKSYWHNKRLIWSAIIGGSFLATAHAASVGVFAEAQPVMFWVLQVIYWTPLVALLFTNSRKVDTALLGALVLGYLAEPLLEIVDLIS